MHLRRSCLSYLPYAKDVAHEILSMSNKVPFTSVSPSAYPSYSYISSEANVQCTPAQFQVRLDHLVRTAAVHPKMTALLDIVRAHFEQQQQAAFAEGATEVSRVIIFTNLRETVTSICEALRQHEPLIQAR
jgi:ERCC4-related helicase